MSARPARPDDLVAIRDVLTRAFVDDPQLNFILQPGVEAMRAFFEVSTNRLTFPHGLVYCDDEHRGAALWTPPGKFHVSWYSQLLNLPYWGRAIGWSRMLKILKATAPLADAHPKVPHFYLMAIGVDAAHRGKGIAGELMGPVLAKCDAMNTPAYLEASKPDLIPLYVRFGFEVQHEIRLGHDGPPMTTMLRAPRQ